MSARRLVSLPRTRTLVKLDKIIDAKRPTMAITTNNSTSVKPFWCLVRIFLEIGLDLQSEILRARLLIDLIKGNGLQVQKPQILLKIFQKPQHVWIISLETHIDLDHGHALGLRKDFLRPLDPGHFHTRDNGGGRRRRNHLHG